MSTSNSFEQWSAYTGPTDYGGRFVTLKNNLDVFGTSTTKTELALHDLIGKMKKFHEELERLDVSSPSATPDTYVIHEEVELTD